MAAERETIVTSLSSPRSTLFSTACFPPRAYGTPVSPVSPPPRGGDTSARRARRRRPARRRASERRRADRDPAGTTSRDERPRTRVFLRMFRFRSRQKTQAQKTQKAQAPRTRGATPRRATRPGRTDIRSRRSFAERRRRPARPARRRRRRSRTNERHARRSFRSFERRCHHSSPFDLLKRSVRGSSARATFDSAPRARDAPRARAASRSADDPFADDGRCCHGARRALGKDLASRDARVRARVPRAHHAVVVPAQ